MEDGILKMVLSQGVFAALFTYLLFYVLKESAKRENKYQEIIVNLTEKFNVLDNVKNTVDKIEEKIRGKF